MDRKFYLEDIPLEDAWAAFRAVLDEANLWRPLPAETVPLSEANGRVTAAPVWARLSSPHYHAAAMDGYAVRAEDTVGALDASPVLFVVEGEKEGKGEGGKGRKGEREQGRRGDGGRWLRTRHLVERQESSLVTRHCAGPFTFSPCPNSTDR